MRHVTVVAEQQDDNLKISIGGGKWLEQGAAIAVSMIVLWPLFFAGVAGMAQQKQLINNLWSMADNFVVTHGGKRVS